MSKPAKPSGFTLMLHTAAGENRLSYASPHARACLERSCSRSTNLTGREVRLRSRNPPRDHPDKLSRVFSRHRYATAGFTLVEIMVVIAVIALAGQLVIANLGALVPSTLLDSASSQLMGQIEYLRSESQLQSKIYQVELDLDEHRWRIILPPEERLVSDQTIAKDTGLAWHDLDERIQFNNLQVPGGRIQRSGRARIVMDENGFSGDLILTLKIRDEKQDNLVWSIRLRGLDRKSELITNRNGEIPRLELIEEGHF